MLKLGSDAEYFLSQLGLKPVLIASGVSDPCYVQPIFIYVPAAIDM
jgi:hypothetical protein